MFAKDGDMDELATVPALANDQGYHRCAVHEQTQRTYATTNPVVLMKSVSRKTSGWSCLTQACRL